MQFVKLVNRTNAVLHGIWDGKHVDIAPGASHVPEQQAIAYKRQNPIMGSEDPMSGDIQYKLGIEEHGDPIEPLPETLKEGIEKWDRSKLPGARPTEVVAGDNGLYALRGAGKSAPLPLDDGSLGGERS